MKVAFGNIQDAEASAKAKQSLMANDCISVLIQLLECDSLGPELPGGENFDMVPCLNDNDDHITLLKSLIERNI